MLSVLLSSSNADSEGGKMVSSTITTKILTPAFENLSLNESDGSLDQATSSQSAFTGSSSNPLSGVSTGSVNQKIERLLGRGLDSDSIQTDPPCPAPSKTWKNRRDNYWAHNKGVALVLLAQFFWTLMNVTTRLLETEGHGHGMHTFQVSIDFYRGQINAFTEQT